MNRGDIGENYVAVHYDNDYTCRIFLYYYYSSRMTTVIAIQSLRNMAGIKRQKQNSTITEIQIVYRYRGKSAVYAIGQTNDTVPDPFFYLGTFSKYYKISQLIHT